MEKERGASLVRVPAGAELGVMWKWVDVERGGWSVGVPSVGVS